MPASNRKTKVWPAQIPPQQSQPVSMNCSRIWHRNCKQDIFPRCKGELFLLILFSNSCSYIASFMGFTSRAYKWTQTELQGSICWLLLPFFPGRYWRAAKAWPGARQRSGNREAALGSRSWSRSQVWASRSTKHQTDHQDPQRQQYTPPQWCMANPPASPKSQPLVSWVTNGDQLAQPELNWTESPHQVMLD